MPAHIFFKILKQGLSFARKVCFPSLKYWHISGMYRMHPFTVKAKIVSAHILEASTFQRPYSTVIIF